MQTRVPGTTRIAAEVRWFLANYALLLAVWFVLAVLQGIALMATSPDGSIPGWSGPPVVQLLNYGLGVVLFIPLILGIPPLVVTLLVWRLAIRLVGHPRLTAYLLAAIAVLATALLVPHTSPIAVAFWAALPAFAYATILRRPPATTRPG